LFSFLTSSLFSGFSSLGVSFFTSSSFLGEGASFLLLLF